jgi:transcription termination factor NusB
MGLKSSGTPQRCTVSLLFTEKLCAPNLDMVLVMALLMASIEVKMPTKAEIPIAIMEAVMIARVLCDLRDENP